MACIICKKSFTLVHQKYKKLEGQPPTNIFIKVYLCENGHYFTPVTRVTSVPIPKNLQRKGYVKYKPKVEQLTQEEINVRKKMKPLNMNNFTKVDKS